MLLHLSIKQFGIIENSNIDFNSGLTVLSGETGAGKSMILAAISQLAGARTSTSYIRYGENKATVEGIFDFPKNEEFKKIIDDLEIDYEDETIILRRDIYSSGKSVCRINGVIVNVSILKKIAGFLIDIHEQHDNQMLLVEKNHISLLDSYGKEDISPIMIEYKELFKSYRNIEEKIEVFKKQEGEVLQKLDFLKYQFSEISSLELEKNEDVELKEEYSYLCNYEKINNLVNETIETLNSDLGVLNGMYLIKENIKKLSEYNSNFEEKIEEIENMYYILDDMKYDLSRLSGNVDFDESRFNYVEERLLEIKHLEKKYSKSVNELVIYKNELSSEIFDLENYDESYDKLIVERDELKEKLKKLSLKLSQIRKLTAEKLEKLIQQELKFLCMEKSIVKIQIKEKDLSFDGQDDVKIMISANLGEPLKSLTKVASGGELSRVMLALKVIFSSSIEAISIIFDEIDTGISGRVSQCMAEKMYQLGRKSQVLCISHLPQTTALADCNLLINKDVVDNRTISNIKELNKEERILEISRMISGNKTTKLSREHAVELLELSEKIKDSYR